MSIPVPWSWLRAPEMMAEAASGWLAWRHALSGEASGLPGCFTTRPRIGVQGDGSLAGQGRRPGGVRGEALTKAFISRLFLKGD
ncbi:MAG: hypothetical protein HQL63_07895 [Magnetococcales bacterium]|nr:hypothetical protein [Magnetococcales bacterium]